MTIPLVTKGMIVPPVSTSTIATSGSIEIEPNRWQMISIPVKFGYFDTIDEEIKVSGSVRSTIYNYVVTQLETLYSDSIENLVEVINTYVGDNDYFYNYVPGFTPVASEHNFPLTYIDGSRDEITPFWIKSKVGFNMVINWSS